MTRQHSWYQVSIMEQSPKKPVSQPRSGLITWGVAENAQPSTCVKKLTGVLHAKLPSDYEAHRSGGHQINFEHLEFNVHLNPNKRAFLRFQTNSQTNLWIANNRANSGIQGITMRSITKTRRDSNCAMSTQVFHTCACIESLPIY